MNAEKIAYHQKVHELLSQIIDRSDQLTKMDFAPYPVDTRIRQEAKRLREDNIKKAGALVCGVDE